jgi:hypothetical protein
MKLAENIDVGYYQFFKSRFENVSSAPTGLGTSHKGYIYFNTTDGKFYGWDGSAFLDLSAGSGGGSLPSQTGYANRALKTDGTSASWAVVSRLDYASQTFSKPSADSNGYLNFSYGPFASIDQALATEAYYASSYNRVKTGIYKSGSNYYATAKIHNNFWLSGETQLLFVRNYWLNTV